MRPLPSIAVIFAVAVFGLVAVRAPAQIGTSGPPPVRSVNGAQGDVVVSTVQRQVSAALDATKGTVTWSFPVPFSNMPTCWPSLSSPNTSYSFDYPTTTAISTSSVTEQVVAHLNTLSIASVAVLPVSLPLAVPPPSGTTITLSCVGALP